MRAPPSRLPIAEIFTSIHGEGYWAGTPMTFIRLAGCTVGKYEQGLSPDPHFPLLPNGSSAATCTTFDGRKFPCDTDFHKAETLTLNEIYNRIPSHIKHVCITGGEPLMHGEKLLELMLYLSKFWVHVETSGTIEMYFPGVSHLHITCSPKKNYIPGFLGDLDEIRIPVGQGLTKEAIDELMGHVKPKYQYIYFSPLCIGDTTVPEPESLKMCMDLVMQYPDTMVSIQMHKVLGVR